MAHIGFLVARLTRHVLWTEQLFHIGCKSKCCCCSYIIGARSGTRFRSLSFIAEIERVIIFVHFHDHLSIVATILGTLWYFYRSNLSSFTNSHSLLCISVCLAICESRHRSDDFRLVRIQLERKLHCWWRRPSCRWWSCSNSSRWSPRWFWHCGSNR